MWLIIILILVILLWPVFKLLFVINRTRKELSDTMNQARRDRQSATSQQRKQHPSYTTRNAEDATYEEIPGAPRPEQETSGPTTDDPIIEDAKWEEV